MEEDISRGEASGRFRLVILAHQKVVLLFTLLLTCLLTSRYVIL